MSETPTTTTSQKSVAIHLQFVLQYASHLYSGTFGGPTLRGKGNLVSTLPICIAVRLQFVLQYASYLYRSTFGKILVVVVTGMFPILEPRLGKWTTSPAFLARSSLAGSDLLRRGWACALSQTSCALR